MPLDFMPTREQVSDTYPLILITGRELYHFNAGTMTYRTPNKDILNTDFLHIHPHDAHRIGLKTNDVARLVSQYGETDLPVVIDPAVRKGEVFDTFNNSDVFLNKLTSPLYDSYVQTPEYKVTAVRVEKIKH
jgi:formate dehydrogenase major subunit